MSSLSIHSTPRALSSQLSPCTRPIPCDQANYQYASLRCPACLDRLMASLSTPIGYGSTPAAQERWDEPGEPEPEYRPTFSDRMLIGRLDDIEWSAFEIGLEGHSVAGSPEYTAEEREAFFRGHAAGFKAFEEDSLASWVADRERDEAAFADPLDSVHPAELAEFAGNVSKIGGRP